MELDKHQAAVSILVAGVALLIVFPIWWNTTKVYRAPLPYDEITELSGHRVRILVTVDVHFESDSFDRSNLTRDYVDSLLNTTFAKYSGGFVYDLQLRTVDFFSKDDFDFNRHAHGVVDTKLLENDLKSLRGKLGVNWKEDSGFNIKVIVAYKNEETTNTKTNSCDCSYGLSGYMFLTCSEKNGRTVLKSIQQNIRALLPEHSKLVDKAPRVISEADSNNIHRRAVQHNQGLQIAFILANPDPDNIMASWNIKEELHCNFMPFLSQLDFLGPYQISSQILYYAELGRKPQKGKERYFYSQRNLPLLVNTLESRLGSFTSNLPTLYFIVYVTPRNQSPLFIKIGKGRWGTSFVSPKWGGIYIHNVQNSKSNNTQPLFHTIDMGVALDTFKEHFKLLVGVRQETGQLKKIATNSKHLSEFDVNLLMLEKAIRNINLARETLLSLSKLIGEIQNLIIGDNIRDLIVMAVKNLTLSIEHFDKGLLQEAYKTSRASVDCSEKAFFDPTLLELLYFPDDQKFAIYIPLFLPLAIPILLSVFKVFRSMKNRGDK